MHYLCKCYCGSLFPAQAGVILSYTQNLRREGAVPRASGGDPFLQKQANLPKNCSPRKRG